MEKSLILMSAYLERFNVIHVHVNIDYYQGKISEFYLKNLQTEQIYKTRIVNDYIEGNQHIYQLMIDNIKLGYEYVIMNNYGLTRPLELKGIVNDPMFDLLYAYNKDDLGADYSTSKTTFKVWAPTAHSVKLQYWKNNKILIEEMDRTIQGVYCKTIHDDLEGVKYCYYVSNGGVCLKATDPYSYGSTANGLESIVVDKRKFTPSIKISTALKSKSDVVIYEVSVRDFTSHSSIDSNSRSQYLGLVEKGLATKKGTIAGLDHIIDLGVSHVQIMPIYDFATVEETQPGLMYNWGYDPSQFNVPEGSYCRDLNDPYSRINECIEMINMLHLSGLRVTMDMVVNHLYDVNATCFERIVPHYYFRNDDQGTLSNGSFCGNDINSECFMVRKYIMDMCKRWQEIYGVDGFRFDLMGILDVYTMNTLEKELVSQDPYCILYGEGWNMSTMLPDHHKAMMDNHHLMPRISFFNDRYRDILKGTTFSEGHSTLGYLSGNLGLINEAMKQFTNTEKFTEINQSINYAECHDNSTVYDYLKENLANEEESVRLKRQKLINAAVILSQGIPFIHCGQEFCRTKQGLHNTYNSPDWINGVDWDLKDIHIDQVHFVKALLKLRKENKGFRYETKKDIQENVELTQLDHQILSYRVKQDEGIYKEILVLFNPSLQSNYYCLGIDEEVILTTQDEVKQEYANVSIEPVSLYIIAKKR